MTKKEILGWAMLSPLLGAIVWAIVMGAWENPKGFLAVMGLMGFGFLTLGGIILLETEANKKRKHR